MENTKHTGIRYPKEGMTDDEEYSDKKTYHARQLDRGRPIHPAL